MNVLTFISSLYCISMVGGILVSHSQVTWGGWEERKRDEGEGDIGIVLKMYSF